MSKAYVLLSGGLDSATALYLARAEFGSVTAVSVVYGQKHKKEVQHAAEIASVAGAEHLIKDISGLLGVGGLTDKELDIPNKDYSELQGVSPTYVPFRNGTLLAILASIASADREAEACYFGAHAEDAANWAYPDCTPEFFGAMACAIFIGSYHKLRLHAPFIHMRKDEIVALGSTLNVPYEMTWSCYKGETLQCGICPTCRSRKQAFKLAGVEDPTTYAA